MTQQELLIQALVEQRNEALDRGAQLAAMCAELSRKVTALEAAQQSQTPPADSAQ
jgi:hypothetical protein